MILGVAVLLDVVLVRLFVVPVTMRVAAARARRVSA